MRELRRQPLPQGWVLISTDYEKAVPGPECPFCPGNEQMTASEVYAVREVGSRPNGAGWWTRVVPNISPFLRIEGDLDPRPQGMYDVMTGVGAHEIVIETPKHDEHWGTMDVVQVERVLCSYAQRIRDLRGDERFRFVMVTKNHGAATSVIRHPHSHLIAVPIVPGAIQMEIRGLREHYERKERCLYCDIVKEERRLGTRVIAETKDYVAFLPFASRYPYETWVMPKEHEPDFADPRLDLADVAGLLRDVMERLLRALDDPAYSFAVHFTPHAPQFEPRYHWHVEIRPRVAEVFGSEWGTGFYITTVAPEEAAERLRTVL